MYKNAVPSDPTDPKAWYGKNKDGEIYKFHSSNDGTAHYSGRENDQYGLNRIPKYAKDRLNGK